MRVITRAIFGLLFLTSTTFADGVLTVPGTGTVSSAPETASFSVTVQSTCYSTLQGAVNDNNSVANSIKDALNKELSSSTECAGAVTTSGLSIIQTTQNDFVQNSCDGWTMTNSVTVNLHTKSTSEKNDQKLEQVVAEKYRFTIATALSAIKSLPNDEFGSTATTYSGISFGLTASTIETLQTEALKLAVKDALKNRDTLIVECNLKLAGNDSGFNEGEVVEQVSYSSGPFLYGNAREVLGDSSPAVAAAEIPVTANVTLKWNVVGPLECGDSGK